jgi:hypothetical protein
VQVTKEAAVAKHAQYAGPPDRLHLYEQLVATVPGIERKGRTLPYTSLNGHMVSFLTEGGSLALRLSPADRAEFIARYETSLHEAHGTVMKDYVAVPDELLGDIDALGPWFAAGHAHVATLAPKRGR